MARNTIYPYGTGGQLPSNIGIVDDLVTGGADKALSAEQGKIIGEELYGSGREEIDLTQYTEYGIYIASATNKWATSSATGVEFIPVEPGDKYQVCASDTKATGYCVLQNSNHNNGETPAYATGYTAVLDVPIGEESDVFTIPSNGHYLLVWTRSNSQSLGPTVYRISDTAVVNGLVTRVENLEDGVSDLDDEVFGKGRNEINLGNKTKYHYYVAAANGQWTYSDAIDIVFVSVSPGDTYQLIASSLGSIYMLLQSANPVAGQTPNYCSGTTQVAVNAGESDEFIIPNDGYYIGIYTKLTSGNVTPELYKITDEPVGGLKDKVAALEDYVDYIALDPMGVKDNRIDYIRSIQAKSKVFSFHEQEMVPTTGAHLNSYSGRLFFTKDAEKFDVVMVKTYQHNHISFLGDSISTYYGFPGSYNSYYTGSNAGITNVYDTWWASLLLKLNCYHNRLYANGGANVTNGLCLQYGKLFSKETTGYAPEIIFILAGINDWVHDITLGTIADALNSNTTFYAAYKYLLANLKATYPNAKIVALTPINSMYLGTTPPYLNGNNNSIRDFCKAIMECADYYSLPYIDLNKLVNINGNNYTSILDDYTHPNKDGMALITNAIVNNIASL